MRNIGLFLLLALLGGCQGGKNINSIYGFPRSYSLTSKAYDTELMVTMPQMVINDSLAVVSSLLGKEEDFLQVYSIPDGFRQRADFGQIGRGPQDFITPSLNSMVGNDVFIHDLNGRRLARLRIGDSGRSVEEIDRVSFQYLDKGQEISAMRIVPFPSDGDGYVGLAFNETPRFFSQWDDSLRFVRNFGDAPVPEKVSYSSSMNFMQGRLQSRGNKFVFAMDNLPYLALYEMNNGEPTQKWSQYFQEPVYGVRGEQILFDKARTFGLTKGLTLGERYIYLIFLDVLLSEEDYQATERFYGNIVFVFDYEGNRVAELNLDHRIAEIGVSSDERKLYAIAVMPDYRFVEYDLPDFKK